MSVTNDGAECADDGNDAQAAASESYPSGMDLLSRDARTPFARWLLHRGHGYLRRGLGALIEGRGHVVAFAWATAATGCGIACAVVEPRETQLRSWPEGLHCAWNVLRESAEGECNR